MFAERKCWGACAIVTACALFAPVAMAELGLLSGKAAQVGQSPHERPTIRALYIPLADHYAGIVAYEKYRDKMLLADYRIERMKSWPLLRAYFMSGEVDMAYIICPQAMDMFREKPNFRWVSLMHRDGNALAINDLLKGNVMLPKERAKRKPDGKVADALYKAKAALGKPTECAVPHLQATHTVVLYKYLKDHGMTLALGMGTKEDVVAIEVPPPKSPSFIKRKNSRGIPASFEQSLPWADVVETGGYGHVAWYSKDVIPWPNGHVECIAIATDECIRTKNEALKEVIYYIHQAGLDIEEARKAGGSDMVAICDMIRMHIPEHNQEVIVQSLRADLNVINYRHLNLDKKGLKQIMDLAVEGGIIKQTIDIDAFADDSFSTGITDVEIQFHAVDKVGFYGETTSATKAKLRELTEEIEELAAWSELVQAVDAQNKEGLTLTSIKALDEEWIAGSRELSSRLQTNAAGELLKTKVLADESPFTEAFLCDNQGAVAGEYSRTSDYWQGDEEKFTRCFNDGNGKVYFGLMEFDESTASYCIQISVPVKDNGKTIGVLVVGVRNAK